MTDRDMQATRVEACRLLAKVFAYWGCHNSTKAKEAARTLVAFLHGAGLLD